MDGTPQSFGRRDFADSPPDISNYCDYREYLSDWIEHKKTAQKGFSLRWLNSRCQFSSPSYMQAILARKRALTLETAVVVSRALRHTEFEAEFLRLLVLRNNARTEKEATKSSQNLDELRRLKNVKEIGDDARLFLARWENIAVYCYLTDRKEMLSFQEIAKSFRGRISEQDLSEVLRQLVYLGFAICTSKEGNKFYHCRNDSILANRKISKHDLNRYHDQILGLGQKLLKQENESGVELNGTTIRTRADKFGEMRAYLAEVRSQFLARFHDDSGEDVFHLETMLLPMTHRKETRSEA